MVLCSQQSDPAEIPRPEGAPVILLEPFIAGGRRMVAEHNVDEVSAILDVSLQDHHSMDNL